MSGLFTNMSDFIRRNTDMSGGNREQIMSNRLDTLGSIGQTVVAGGFISSWLMDGCPGPGVAPGTTPRVPGRATAGALGQADPVSGHQRWLTYIEGNAWQSTQSNNIRGHFTLMDRLADVSGASGTSTSLVSPSGGLVPTRYTDGYGVEIWVEIYSQIGTTAQTLTVNYTDTANASKSTTVALGGTPQRQACFTTRVPWAAGGYGCKSVQSFQLGASTGTAGNYGITLVRPLVDMPFHNTSSPVKASLLHEPIEIVADACLYNVIRTIIAGAIPPRVDMTYLFLDGP